MALRDGPNPAESGISALASTVPTKWLIPLRAGLYQLSFSQIPRNAPVLNLLLQDHRFTPAVALLRPDYAPRPFESLRSLGEAVLRVVVLAEATLKIRGMPTIESTITLTLENIYPEIQHSAPVKKAQSWKIGPWVKIWLPGTDPRCIGAKWLIPP